MGFGAGKIVAARSTDAEILRVGEERNATLRLDLGIALDRSLGRDRPVRIRVDDAGHPSFVVVACEHPRVGAPICGFGRAEQGDPVGQACEVASGSTADHTSADHDDSVHACSYPSAWLDNA